MFLYCTLAVQGETEQMEEQTVSGWDWAHLRLCCTVQGVKEELIQGDTCQCVALQELSSNFSAGTSFEARVQRLTLTDQIFKLCHKHLIWSCLPIKRSDPWLGILAG